MSKEKIISNQSGMNDEVVIKPKRNNFTIVSNKIGNNIKNGDAFLLWFYLTSKTDNWKVIKSHLCSHFGWSMKKLNHLFQVLCGHQLAKTYQLKAEKGKFGKYMIEIHDGENFVEFDEKTLVDKSKKTKKINTPHRYPKNRKAVKPLSGKSTATKYCITTKDPKEQNKEKAFKTKAVDNSTNLKNLKAQNKVKHSWAPMANEKAAIEKHEKLKQESCSKETIQFVRGIFAKPELTGDQNEIDWGLDR